MKKLSLPWTHWSSGKLSELFRPQWRLNWDRKDGGVLQRKWSFGSWFVLTVPLLIGSIIAFLFVQNQTLKISRLIFLKFSFIFFLLFYCICWICFWIQTSFKFIVSSQILLDHIFSFHTKNNKHSEFIDCWKEILASKGIQSNRFRD